METQALFVLKVLVFSAGLSILIKYGGSTLDIAPTLTNVLLAVLMPTLIMTITLLWRTFQQRQLD
jgi:hypothetical protein